MTNVHSYKTVTYKDIYPGIDLQFISSEEIPFKYNFVVYPGGRIDDIRIEISGPEKVKKVRDVLRCETTIGEVDESIPKCFYTTDDLEIPVDGRFYRIAEHVYGFKVEQELPDGAALFIDPIPTRRWATYYGTSSCWFGGSTIDNNGNSYITGTTTDPINIATLGAFQSTISLLSDAFLVKFSPGGQRILGTYYGGTGVDQGLACSVDHSGNIYLDGFTSSPNLATPGAWQTSVIGTADALLVKFNSGGIRLWATYYGGNEPTTDNQEEFTFSLVDSLDNVYCCGITSSPTNIASPGAHQTLIGGGWDAFIVKFTSTGVRYWATYYGGFGQEQTPSCTMTKSGLLFLSGTTKSADNISTPGSFMPNYSGLAKAFLACFDLDGVRQWGTYFGGLSGSTEISHGCCADSSDGVYLVGKTTSSNNIGTNGTYQPSSTGGGGFLEKFNTSGSRLWGTYYGQSDVFNASTSDSNYVYICGQTSYGFQDPFIASPHAYQTVEAGNVDAFLAKFDENGQRIWGTYYGGPVWDQGYSCNHDHANNVYLYGYTTSPNNSSDEGLCLRDPKHNVIASQNGLYPDYFPPQSVFLVKFTECYSPDTALQIYGPSALCQNSTGVVFSIDPLVTVTSYQWCVTGNLTITSGQGTTSITVDVGPALGTDTISVYGINACDTGFPKVITRRVNPRPNPAIIGTDTTCTGASNLFTTIGGMNNYIWDISAGGSIVAGGTISDSSCNVVWTTPGSNWVRLNYTDTNGCEGMTPVQHDIWVIAGDTVDVSIISSANPVCAGTSVTFTATPLHGGLTPSYQWMVNGVNVGINSPVYTYIPASLDLVSCILTSSEVCTMSNPDTSNVITMMVSPFLPVSVSVTASADSICAGTTVNYTATPANGGTNPIFQWKVNSLNVGINSPTYAYIPLNGDVVECALTSSELCTTGSPALSLPVTMTVFPNLPVSVSVTPSANPVLPRNTGNIHCNPVNGGITPSYQWQVNGINVGTNNPVFTYYPCIR